MAKGCVDVDYTHMRDAVVSPFSASKASTTKGACEAGDMQNCLSQVFFCARHWDAPSFSSEPSGLGDL